MPKDKDSLLLEAYNQFLKGTNGLIDFTIYTFEQYVANWHHRLIARKLQELYRGDFNRLMIYAPPRIGKSELVTRRFPAYVFGKNPNTEIVACSYSADLADSFNVDAQRIMQTPQFRELYPNTYTPITCDFINRSKFKQNAALCEIVINDPQKKGYGLKSGYYKTAGVNGSLTGFGYNLGIIDDPFKNRDEADSSRYRDKVFNWWSSTFLSRAEKDAKIVLTMTRWHEDDLGGRLMKTGGWEILKLPHVMDDEFRDYDPRKPGELIWPEKFDEKYIAELRRDGGLQDFFSLHQQSPFTEGGNIIKGEWWVRYEPEDLPRFFDEIIQSWDFTFKKTKSSDYVCGQVWGYKGANKYLLDMVRRRMGFVESKAAVKNLTRKWPNTGRIYVEDKANGPAIIDALKKEIPTMIPFTPKGSKESRAHAISGQAEAGNLHIPADAPYMADFLSEWNAFPNGNNDDVVDSTTQAIISINDHSIADFSSWID